MHYAKFLCSPAKTQKETEWNKNNPKPKGKQQGGVTAYTGKCWTLLQKVYFYRGTKWGKAFHTRKALFRLKQVHLAAFLAVLKLKAEKLQRESMQATGQSSSLSVPREAEDMIRNQPQTLSETYCSHSADIVRPAAPPAETAFHTAASTRIVCFKDSDQAQK